MGNQINQPQGKEDKDMMCRQEKRYMWTEDIIAWGHGQYARPELERLTMPELLNVHNKIYNQHLAETDAIRK